MVKMKNALKSFLTIFSIHSIHGDALKLFRTIFSIHSIHGDKKWKGCRSGFYSAISLRHNHNNYVL